MKLRKISFTSLLKLLVLIGICGGILIGILMLVLSLLGFDTYVNFGSQQLTGVPAGILSLILAPVICAIFGVFAAFFSFLPFRLLLFFTRGISLNITMKEIVPPAVPAGNWHTPPAAPAPAPVTVAPTAAPAPPAPSGDLNVQPPAVNEPPVAAVASTSEENTPTLT